MPTRAFIAYVRIVDGSVKTSEPLLVMSTNISTEAQELGAFAPVMTPNKELSAGEVGYIATGLKIVRDCQVGDTITSLRNPAIDSLPGYRAVKPMVFAGLFPVESNQYEDLRQALERLHLKRRFPCL